MEPPQVVTLFTVHQDIQEIKAFIYRSEDHEKRITKAEEAITELKVKLATIGVVYGLITAVLTAVLIKVATNG